MTIRWERAYFFPFRITSMIVACSFCVICTDWIYTILFFLARSICADSNLLFFFMFVLFFSVRIRDLHFCIILVLWAFFSLAACHYFYQEQNRINLQSNELYFVKVNPMHGRHCKQKAKTKNHHNLLHIYRREKKFKRSVCNMLAALCDVWNAGEANFIPVRLWDL